MFTLNSSDRIQQELALLILLISEGREYFFKKMGTSLTSPSQYINHFVVMDLFGGDKIFQQLELNIQLLYIKLHAYYSELKIQNKVESLSRIRNVYAHNKTNQLFNKKVSDYNFMIWKVSKNFKKIEYLCYVIGQAETETKTLLLNIDSDISDFLYIWKENKTR
ncbi:MAG: hypothetical protein RI996_52 [Candidatus Parcubacteria bacterium]|jgi:hypothetical protein